MLNSIVAHDERASDRAAAEAGYMDIDEYFRKWGAPPVSQSLFTADDDLSSWPAPGNPGSARGGGIPIRRKGVRFSAISAAKKQPGPASLKRGKASAAFPRRKMRGSGPWRHPGTAL
jgi:hypothetical protein